MSLTTAQQLAWSLATTLMTCIVLFQAGTGYGVAPAAELEGDPATVVHEFNPYQP